MTKPFIILTLSIELQSLLIKISIMQKSIFLIFSLILLFSCNDDDVSIPIFCEGENCDFDCITDLIPTEVFTNDCLDNFDCSYKLFENSKVDTDVNSLGVKNGDKNVFQVIISTIGDPAIADDEFTNVLVFELDASQESFMIENAQLEDVKANFQRRCFCSDVDFRPVKMGCIQGKLLSSGIWAIQGNVEIEYDWGNLPVLFEAEFE